MQKVNVQIQHIEKYMNGKGEALENEEQSGLLHSPRQ
jgi:hypothetical protein